MVIDRIDREKERLETESNFAVDYSYLLLDYANYFQLKLEVFGDDMLAVENELREYDGMRVFYNEADNDFFKIV